MHVRLKQDSLDWALTHICRFCDNDLFPRLFEFDAIRENWQEVKSHLLAIDLESYVPQPPLLRFAPKVSGMHRAVHRLDPVDSLIYTAMVHQLQESMLQASTFSREQISTRRVETSAAGSFFGAARNAWQHYTDRIERLAESHKDGYIVAADIFNFFGHIQPKRLGQLLTESPGADADQVNALSRFLTSIGTASRGIPIGPSASTVLSELILATIDGEISKHTMNYARWGDDLRLFFHTQTEASDALRGVSEYIHKTYELMLATEKTRIMPVKEFMARYYRGLPDESVAAGSAEIALSQFVGQSHIVAQHYDWMSSVSAEPQPMGTYVLMRALPEYEAAGNAYLTHFNKAMNCNPPDLLSARRIMRKAAAYRIRSLLPSIAHRFDQLTPVIRETCTYLKTVLDESEIQAYAAPLRNAWENKQQGSTYVNDWTCHVLTSPGFNLINLPGDYYSILGLRNQALIALRKRDVHWVRDHVSQLSDAEPWDRRGLLYASQILPPDERARISTEVMGKGGIVERSLVRLISVISSVITNT
jgi:hypothetical protein